MKKAILTLPMMPVDGTNFGKFVTPIICELLRNMYGGSYYHCINLLDSFNNREEVLENYLNSLNENNIKYDYLWYDKNYIAVFLNNIDQLIKKGYIQEIYTDIYTCNCGIVEIEENKIGTCNQQNLKFVINGNNLVCKHCGGVCQKHREKVLTFTPYNVKREDILFAPSFLNKDARTYDSIVINSYTTISRKRETGIRIQYNNSYYNIDIDFLWATYLATFPEKEKIVVSGNRMLYQLFLVGTIEKCLNPNAKTILYGTSYLTNIKEITSNNNFIEEEYFRKLAILFNLKWSKKESNYDESILKYLKNMNVEKRKKMYDIVNQQIVCENDFFSSFESNVRERLNMQENIKKLKKEVK